MRLFKKKGALWLGLAVVLSAGIFLGCQSVFSKSLTLETENKAVASTKNLDVGLKLQTIYRMIAKSVTPAVVSIQVESEQIVNNPYSQFFSDPFFRQFFGEQGQMPKQFKQKLQALGSGFIVTPDGYIFSNYHVVKDATKIQVVLSDKRQFKAKVIGTDPDTDIALLKINAKNLPVAAVGDSKSIQVGDLVMAIGNPFGLTGTYTSGIISFIGRPGMMSGFQHFIQTDAPVNPGNSGGPLVNIHGQVIGINTAIQTQSGGYEGISFAVPINTAKNIANQLITSGKIRRGYLGVSIGPLDKAARKVFHIPDDQGVLVTKVEKNGPAEKAGLKQGDIIIRVNGSPVETPDDLQVAIGSLMPGTKVTLETYRRTKRRRLTVTLAERPRSISEASAGGNGNRINPSGETYKYEGVIFREASQALLEQNNAQYGIEVQSVNEDSPLSGTLQAGDLIIGINDTEIHNLKELKEFAKKNSNPKSLVFMVMEKGFLIYRGFEQ
jgi:serine protease Do